MEVKVFDITGKETGRKVILQDQVFGINPNTHAISMEIKRYLSAQRQGTHKTKERSEVSGSTRKLHRQKGTENFLLKNPKTKLFLGILSLLNLRKKKVLMVYGKPNKNLFLSSRNLEKNKL